MEPSREYYIIKLKEIAEKENRLPQKSDFSDYDVMRIKGFFGPWPWALEAAGLKESKQPQRKQQNYEKRQRAKTRRKGEQTNA